LHLVDCVQENRSPVLNIEHAAHVVEILAQAARSAEQGSTLNLG
jgi:hypothetical protein